MARCVQFHHMYDKDAEACGMSDTSRSYYDRYREAVRKISAQGIDQDSIYPRFHEGAYRVILQMKNDDARTDALSYVSECLHNGEKVTDSDLKGWLRVWRIEHEDFTNVNSSGDKPPVDSLTNVKEPDPVAPVMLGDRLKSEPHGTESNTIPPAVHHPITDTDIKVSSGTDTLIPSDPVQKREEMERRAEAFIECLSQRQQLLIADLLREERSWKPKDVLAFGIDALVESRKRGRK